MEHAPMTWHPLPGVGTKVRLAAAAVCCAALAACASSAAAPRAAKVQVLLTDAPSDMLDSAQVWISRVYLQEGGGSQPDTTAADTATADTATADHVDLFNGPAHPLEYDLPALRDSLEADVTGLVPVNAGTYQGLRFVVDSARVTLKNGYTFQDGTSSAVLRTPSADTSGIKVKLRDVLVVDDGQDITVTVDFNVDANFAIQTGQQAGQVSAILFTPVLAEKSIEMTAP
jgi:hypothetical protein